MRFCEILLSSPEVTAIPLLAPVGFIVLDSIIAPMLSLINIAVSWLKNTERFLIARATRNFLIHLAKDLLFLWMFALVLL